MDSNNINEATVLSSMQTGAPSPLDFVQQNLRARQQSVNPAEQVMDNIITQETNSALQQEELDKQQSKVLEPVEKPKELDEQVPIINEEDKDPSEAPEGIEDNDQLSESIRTNIRNMRNRLRELNKDKKTSSTKFNELSEELEKYKTGAVVPDALQEKENKIAELIQYKSLVDFRLSDEYEDKFHKPLQNIETRLAEIAKDYEYPLEIMGDALAMQNQAELNRFLSQNFDEVGALEVKQLIKEFRGVQNQALDAEKTPALALAKLRQDQELARQARKSQAMDAMQATTRKTWINAINEIRQEGKAIEIIPDDSNPEHNEKYVQPILKSAAGEYGKIVTALAEHGLEALPEEVSHALARIVLLAHTSAVAIETRDNALKQVSDLLENTKKTAPYYRPNVGGGSPGGSKQYNSVTDQKFESPEQAGAALLNSVMGRK